MSSEATIDRLQIEVETKAEGAIKGLKGLKSALTKIDKLGNSSGIDNLYKRLQKISNLQFDNLNQLNALGDTLRKVEQLSKKVDKLSSSISKVPGSADVSVDTDGVVDATADVGDLDDALRRPKNTHVDVDSSGVTAAEQKTSRFRTALDKVRSAATKVSSGIKSVSSRLKEASSSFSKTTKKASQLSQIFRIVVLYGGAFRLFSMLTQGVSEGLKNVAKYNEETATAMNRLSTMSLYLKNSIGAALYPVVVALTPALQAMTNAVVKAFEAMGQLVSLLSGKTTYLKAKEYLKEYGDEASKTANKIKKSFAGMDEITVLGQKDDSSSGENYGDMFEESEIDNPHVEALVPFFQGLGTVLGSCFEKIKELASDHLYPWLVKLGEWCKENPETLEKIGEGLATVAVALVAMKGAMAVITPLSKFFDSVGGAKNGVGILGTVAGAIVQLMGAFDSWENGMTWENLGEQLTGIGIAIGAMAVSVGHIGVGIASIVGGIVLTVSSIRDWIENGTSWQNFLGVMIGLAAVFGGISVLVGSWIPMAIGAVVATVMAIVMWWDEISAFFVNLWNSIIGFFVNIGKAIGNFFVNLWSSIAGFFVDLWNGIVGVWNSVVNWFNTRIIQPIVGFFRNLWKAVSGFFVKLWNDIVSVWTAVSTWFNDKIIQPIVNFFEGALLRIGQIFEGCWLIIQAVWKIVSTWFNDKVIQPIVRLFQTVWEKVSGFFVALWNDIVALWNTVATWFDENVIQPIVNFFRALWETVSSFFVNLWNDIVACWQFVSTWFDENVIQPVVEFFRGLWETISGFFVNLWNDIVGIWNSVAAWFNNKVIQPIVNAWNTAINKIREFFTSLWNGIKRGLVDAMNGIIGGVEKAINWIVGAINKLIGGFDKVVQWAADVLGKDWGGVSLVREVSLQRIGYFATGGFPEDGLFMANHGELVGKFSNGKTAVANNEQIVDGIASGVYAANQDQNELLREQNKLLRQLVEKQSNGQIDVTTITSAMMRKNRRDGKTVVPVGI